MGRSIRYIRCAPLPESARIGAGNPQTSVRNPVILRATSRAASCSSSVELIPAGRFGSISTASHRRSIISASAVVLASLGSRVSIRFARRERRAGLTGFRVTYIPRDVPAASRASIFSAASAMWSASKYPLATRSPKDRTSKTPSVRIESARNISSRVPGRSDPVAWSIASPSPPPPPSSRPVDRGRSTSRRGTIFPPTQVIASRRSSAPVIPPSPSSSCRVRRGGFRVAVRRSSWFSSYHVAAEGTLSGRIAGTDRQR